MKQIVIIICFFVFQATGVITKNVYADDARARRIMQKVEDRETGNNQTSDMEMVLIDKKGKKRIRKTRLFGKKKGDDDLQIMFFTHPSDVKGTGFLTWDYDDPDKDDDQWLYLPALHKTKRIASSDKNGSFMGSDLNYSDMTSRELNDYEFKFYKPKEMEIKGVKVWAIESKPRSAKIINKTGYTKSIMFVRQDNYVVIRTIAWEKKRGYKKFLEVKKLTLIDNIWVPLELYVKRKNGKQTVHGTILKLSNVKFNQKLNSEMFTIRRLEKGL